MEIKEQPILDVLIVGGGPAGLAVASKFQGHGLLVHQDREIGRPVRTSGGSWLSEMRRLGIPERLYHRLSHAKIFSDTRELHLPLEADPVVVLDVTALYQWLAEASEIEIRCETKFIGVRKTQSGFIATLRGPDRQNYELRARQIIDASGWHRAVLSALDLGAPPERRGIGIEYEYPIGAADPTRGVLFFGRSVPTGYGWAFPTRAGTIRLGVGVIQPETEVSPKDLMGGLVGSGALARMGIDVPQGYHVNSGILPSEAFARQMVFDDVIRVGDSAKFRHAGSGRGHPPLHRARLGIG